MSETIPSKSGRFLDSEAWDALKAAGYTENELLADQPFGPMIASYTRAQAIADGVLVDLMGATGSGGRPLVHEAGFKVHTAMTAAAFRRTVLAGTTEDAEGNFIFPGGQSLTGRLWDVLSVLMWTIRTAKESTDRLYFKVDVDVNGDGKHETVRLWSLIGPGDDAEPVLTIMLEGED